jgi:hypothetical protein
MRQVAVLVVTYQEQVARHQQAVAVMVRQVAHK